MNFLLCLLLLKIIVIYKSLLAYFLCLHNILYDFLIISKGFSVLAMIFFKGMKQWLQILDDDINDDYCWSSMCYWPDSIALIIIFYSLLFRFFIFIFYFSHVFYLILCQHVCRLDRKVITVACLMCLSIH